VVPRARAVRALGARGGAQRPGPVIAQAISTTLLRLRAVDARLVARLAVRIRVEHPDADMVFATSTTQGSQRSTASSSTTLIDQLVSVRDLGHFGTHLIADLDADRMLAVWRRRLERADGPGYRAVPYHDFKADMLGGDPAERRRVLAALLDGAASLPAQGLRSLGPLFWRFAVPGLKAMPLTLDRDDGRRARTACDHPRKPTPIAHSSRAHRSARRSRGDCAAKGKTVLGLKDTNVEPGDLLAARRNQIDDALAAAKDWLVASGTINAAITVIRRMP
jgi:hypothetical protein